MEVNITVNRGTAEKADSKTYLLTAKGKSKKGTFLTYSPAGESADLPAFVKVYVKTKRDNGKAKGKAKAEANGEA